VTTFTKICNELKDELELLVQALEIKSHSGQTFQIQFGSASSPYICAILVWNKLYTYARNKNHGRVVLPNDAKV
jgi:hypothetical protein